MSALSVLLLLRLVGARLPWGWLSMLLAAMALVTPRGLVGPLGPALFVAACLSLVVWLVNRPRRARDHGPPAPGSRERDAQLLVGLSGERHVGQVLAHELPPEYVLINGLKLPRGAGDIDHLVVGPTGVFLLETKTMAGRIVCAPDGTWTRTKVGRGGTPYAAYIGNPAAQVQRNIYAVRDCLRRRVPSLFGGRPLWIEGLIVFAHPRTDLVAEHSRVPAVRLDQAVPEICGHLPQRPLQTEQIEVVVDALLVEGQERQLAVVEHAQSAQALVETALVLPVVLSLLFGTLALSRVVQAQTAVVAVAHEAARAGALARSSDDAIRRMRQRVDLVAPGVGLDPRALILEWDVSTFGRDRGHVVATVRYTVELGDLPLAGWVPAPGVRAEHVEWVDPFRAGLSSLGGAGP
ncbi:MAG: NERD domain-containing protein [Chloroflexi bacterium]|nr:NERD domain-containing protein [Chloroflexota bacterium]